MFSLVPLTVFTARDNVLDSHIDQPSEEETSGYDDPPGEPRSQPVQVEPEQHCTNDRENQPHFPVSHAASFTCR